MNSRTEEGHLYETLDPSPDEPRRVLSAACAIGGKWRLIRVARSEAQIREHLRAALIALAAGLLGITILVGLGSYGLARRALAPVGVLAAQAGLITAERLHERLPIENPDDELGRLALVFNEMLARLERSFEQMRRFTADASHEMRTPLTALRAVGEVGLREPRDDAAYREIIGSMLEEVDRLTRLVESLLTLSRADAGHLHLSRERVDLAELAREVAAHLGVLAEEKRQTIAVEAPEPAFAEVDRLVLRQALVNLVDNAVKYSPEGARVRIVVRSGPVVEVIDSGPGIEAEHRERVFERFYRVDPARSHESGGGAGLGLSIVAWAVQAHGGTITLESRPGEGSTFRIDLSPKTGGA